MSTNDNSKFYLGDIIIKGKQVSAFTVAPSKKRASEIFNCTQNYISKNFEIWSNVEASQDDRFSIGVDYPEKLFVSSSTMGIDLQRDFFSNNI